VVSPFVSFAQLTDVAALGLQPSEVSFDEIATPLTIKQMPGMSSCKAVARAIVEMSGGVDNVRCVAAFRDWR
jgi:hypothetical protein